MWQVPVTPEELDDASRPWVLRTFGNESLFSVVAVSFLVLLSLNRPQMLVVMDSDTVDEYSLREAESVMQYVEQEYKLSMHSRKSFC